MGEHSYATLRIGGRVEEPTLRKLIEELEPDLDLDSALEMVKLADEPTTLELVDESASYAMFEDLEVALMEAGIAFDRESTPCAEFPECVRQWRPGMEEPYDATTDQGQPLVSVDEIRSQLHDPGALAAWLDKHHPNVPDLEPFVLIEEENAAP